MRRRGRQSLLAMAMALGAAALMASPLPLWTSPAHAGTPPSVQQLMASLISDQEQAQALTQQLQTDQSVLSGDQARVQSLTQQIQFGQATNPTPEVQVQQLTQGVQQVQGDLSGGQSRVQTLTQQVQGSLGQLTGGPIPTESLTQLVQQTLTDLPGGQAQGQAQALLQGIQQALANLNGGQTEAQSLAQQLLQNLSDLSAGLSSAQALASGVQLPAPAGSGISGSLGSLGGSGTQGQTQGGTPTPILTPAPTLVPHRHLKSVTPEDFGAVGNGRHDDTRAVQNALDAASGGGVLDLPSGKTFRCTHSLNLLSGTTVRGSGPNSKLLFSWTTTRGGGSGGKYYVGLPWQHKTTSNIALENFAIQGAGSGFPSGPNSVHPNGLTAGLSLKKVDHYQITNLDISDVPGISLGIRGGNDGTIAGNDIHNSGRDGINASWWNSTNLTNLLISHNTIADVGDDAMDLSGTPGTPGANNGPPNRSSLPNHLEVSNNTISGWPSNVNGRALGRGVILRSITDSQMVANQITNTFADGILLTGSQNLAGDYDPATHSPWRSSDVQILDNTVQGAGQLSRGSSLQIPHQPTDGIEVTYARTVVIAGNSVQDSKGQNVATDSCADGCVTSGNWTSG